MINIPIIPIYLLSGLLLWAWMSKHISRDLKRDRGKRLELHADPNTYFLPWIILGVCLLLFWPVLVVAVLLHGVYFGVVVDGGKDG